MKLLSALLLSIALLLAGCSEPKRFVSTDLSMVDWGKDFSLTDHKGQPRRLADFRGKAVVLFFGYTQCPDVCPTTLSDLALARQKLGPAGQDLQVIFITVDPERDTQAVLAQYVPGFDPSFVGLYGSAAEIERTAREFKVFYQKVPGKTATSYTIDHTAGSYVFDRDGRVRLFVKHAQGVDALVGDLKRLL
jgi:protein SCO1/2